MDSNTKLFIAFFALMMVIATISVVRGLIANSRLKGMQAATLELIRGVSSNYEREGVDVPEDVAKEVDQLKAAVARQTIADKKAEAHMIHLWGLGRAMGSACVGVGFESGNRFQQPSDGEIRVDLTLKELLTLRWLADCGFENMMMPNYHGLGTRAFESEHEAESAARAIESLEFRIPKKHRDPDDPYASSGNRQSMIWTRWPSSAKQG